MQIASMRISGKVETFPKTLKKVHFGYCFEETYAQSKIHTSVA